MFKKIIIVLLCLYSPISLSEQVSEERFQKLVQAWDLLIPEDAYDFVPEKVDYKIMNDPEFQEKLEDAGKKINNLIDGKTIELAGFMVPIEVNGTNVSKFLLVPEAGQCIHVPPPPISQTVLVNTKDNPTKLRDIYIPVIVSGKILAGTQSYDMSNSLANDSNPVDIARSQVYNNIDSGYTLTEVTNVDVLTYSDNDSFE